MIKVAAGNDISIPNGMTIRLAKVQVQYEVLSMLESSASRSGPKVKATRAQKRVHEGRHFRIVHAVKTEAIRATGTIGNTCKATSSGASFLNPSRNFHRNHVHLGQYQHLNL